MGNSSSEEGLVNSRKVYPGREWLWQAKRLEPIHENLSSKGRKIFGAYSEGRSTHGV